MMTANLHFDERGICTSIRWVRRHGGNGRDGSADYFAVTLTGDGGEVTLYLSPAQLESLADKLSQAAQDRDVVLAEERKEPSPVDNGGGG